MSTVYVTHGRKYHTDPACPRMINGENFHDWEGDIDYGGGFTAGTYRREDPSPQYAAMRGKLPCLGCVPAEERVFPPLYGQDFGHEPFEYDGVPICARCYTTEARCSIDAFDAPHRQIVRVVVLWPCTSAIILGLVNREEALR